MKHSLLCAATLLSLAACNSSTSTVATSSGAASAAPTPAVLPSTGPASTPVAGALQANAYTGLALKVDGAAASVAYTLQSTKTADSDVFILGVPSGTPVPVGNWTVVLGYSGGAQTTLTATFNHVTGADASQTSSYSYQLIKGANGQTAVAVPTGATGDATVTGSLLALHLTATITAGSGDTTPHAFDLTASALPL